MNEYVPIICLGVGIIFGTVVGSALTYIGFKLGFRASYEIRHHKGELPEDDEKGLFEKKKEPAEFELLDEEEDKQKE